MTTNLLANSPLAWAISAVRMPDGTGFRPYDYQARLLTDRSQRVIVLKARQVGISFTAALLVAHEALFRPGSLSLIVSRDQGAAAHFLSVVYDVLAGLEHPPVLEKSGMFQAQLDNGSRIVSQPSTSKAGRGYAATLVVLDEFAFAEYSNKILKAVSPTLARANGRLLVISTPNGPAGTFYRLWQGVEGGTWSRHEVPWTACPLFDAAWADRTRPNYTASDFASEFECSFSESGGVAVFDAADVDAMRDGWLGEQPPVYGREYVAGVDVGRRKDATVITVVDTTEQPWQVVQYRRLERAPYAQIASEIARVSEEYDGGAVYIESNGIGDPILEGLLDEGLNVRPFLTTAKSKANALTLLARCVEQRLLKAGADQLLSELKTYRWDDQAIVQDSVMSAAIAVAAAEERKSTWVLI